MDIVKRQDRVKFNEDLHKYTIDENDNVIYNNENIIVYGNGNITIRGNGNVTIYGNGNVVLYGNGNIIRDIDAVTDTSSSTTTNNVIELRSVTETIHKHFPKFNADMVIKRMMSSKNWPQSQYYGMTAEQIKKQWDDGNSDKARKGTEMHKRIENRLNLGYFEQEGLLDYEIVDNERFETWWNGFTKKLDDSPFAEGGYKLFTEFLVYSEKYSLSGTMDLLIVNTRHEAIILDWKRSKEIKRENKYQSGYDQFRDLGDCNYNHYSIQLNIYRQLLELDENTDYKLKVVKMYMVVLEPGKEGVDEYEIQKRDIQLHKL